MDHFDVGTLRVAGIGVGLTVFATDRVINCRANTTVIAFTIM